MLRAVGLFFILAGMWWLWSGHATAMLLGFGLLSCLLVVWLAVRMDVVDREALALHLSHRIPFYWAWLCVEILRSNLDTCKRILRPATLVRPVVDEVIADQDTDLGKVIYTNSITLTPGTLSMQLEGDKLQVHALDQSMIDDLHGGAMAARVKRLG